MNGAQASKDQRWWDIGQPPREIRVYDGKTKDGEPRAWDVGGEVLTIVGPTHSEVHPLGRLCSFSTHWTTGGEDGDRGPFWITLVLQSPHYTTRTIYIEDSNAALALASELRAAMQVFEL